MNTDALRKILPRWKAASKRTHSLDSKTAFWAGKDKEKMLPALIEAGTAPATNLAQLADAFDDILRPRAFEYGCKPASEATRNYCADIWQRYVQLQGLTWSMQPWKRPTAEQANELKSIIDVVMANVFNAVLITGGNEAGIRVTRDKVTLSTKSRYRPAIFNVRLIEVLDKLKWLGLLQMVIGEVRVDGHNVKPGTRQRYKQTEIRATNTTIDQMCRRFIVDARDTTIDRTGQEIIRQVSERDKRPVEYPDSDITANLYRGEVVKINDMLKHLNLTVLSAPAGPFVDDRDRFQVRQFIGSWTGYGRLHGGCWADGRMSKIQRRLRLRLQEEETLEVDFHAIGLHLLYAEANHPVPAGDLYDIPGIEQGSRAGIKILTACLTNGDTLHKRRFPEGTGALFTPKDRAFGCQIAVSKILDHHHGIKALLGKSRGLDLMFKESQVLIAVLLEMVDNDLVGLPLHDCIICPASQALSVKEIMERTVSQVTGIHVQVRVK